MSSVRKGRMEMKKVVVFLLFLVLGTAVYPGSVELYYNGKLISSFPDEQATGYSVLLLTTTTPAPNVLRFDIQQNYNRDDKGNFAVKVARDIQLSRLPHGRMFQTQTASGSCPGGFTHVILTLALPDSANNGQFRLSLDGNNVLFGVDFDGSFKVISAK
jgi:hypothetical protein